MLVHFGTADSSDLFKAVLTMLDPHVAMTLVPLAAKPEVGEGNGSWIQQDVDRSQQLRREVNVYPLPQGEPAQEIVRLASEQKFNVILIGKPSESSIEAAPLLNVDYIVEHAPCWVCVVTPKPIPDVADTAGS